MPTYPHFLCISWLIVNFILTEILIRFIMHSSPDNFNLDNVVNYIDIKYSTSIIDKYIIKV